MTAVGLLWNFMRRRTDSLEPLCLYFENRTAPLQRVSGRDYAGLFSGVRVCNDICGYEVKLGWYPGAELLDCVPAYYGLTSAQADRLYNAILSCVPGSCAYADKQVQQGRLIK